MVPSPRNDADLCVAKQRLGVDHLLLQIHDASFPSDADEDFGRGSPYSFGAERLFHFARKLGFDGIQLGPQGMVSRGNLSPYEGTLFSRNPLNLPLRRLAEEGRISKHWLASRQAQLRAAGPQPALAVIEDLFGEAQQELVRTVAADDRSQAQSFLECHADWLVPDALYDALCRDYQAAWWGDWHRHSSQAEFDQRIFAPLTGEERQAEQRLGELREQHAKRIADYALIQWLLAEEHRRLRARLSALGLTLFADLQVGLAPQDIWSRRSLFLTEYRLGAPPSRTNPEGQPWGFSVLDPLRYGTPAQPGPVLKFIQARLDRVLTECDGLRIDHPHGWIDPWVYRADDPDSLHAVQQGARLFSSPAENDHPLLAAWAVARSEQIRQGEARHADGRVADLDQTQVELYARQMAMILERLAAHGRPQTGLACEVLSTLPYPIFRVMQRFGLGRFRVTSKLKLDDPTDVYRLEHAAPEDWSMLGTHDTATIWHYAEEWRRAGLAPQWGRYLAGFLAAEPHRESMARQIADSPGELVQALFAGMLASRARQLSVFFPDVFGLTERYNHPGTVSANNWRLRLPADFESLYADNLKAGQALDIPRCLSLALSSRAESSVNVGF